MNETPPCSIHCCKGVSCLKQVYPIFQGDFTAGEAHVSRHGLYYHIHCVCSCSCEDTLRVHVRSANQITDLGILVPEKDVYTTKVWIAIQKLGEGDLHFFIQPKESSDSKQWIPIIPEQPFSCISQLDQSNLRRKADKLFAEIANT